MGLEFWDDLDEENGSCPHCRRFDGGLIYTSFSKFPVGCESCLWAKKAAGEGVAYLERLKKERDEACQRGLKAVKELALELGRKRLERMKNE